MGVWASRAPGVLCITFGQEAELQAPECYTMGLERLVLCSLSCLGFGVGGWSYSNFFLAFVVLLAGRLNHARRSSAST